MRYATENDERVRRRILPVRVVKTWGNVENAQALLEDKQGEAYLGHYDGCTLTSRADGHAAVLLDFGAEFHGTLRITTELVNGAVQTVNVRMRFGESASEALAPLGWKGACNDHAERDRVYALGALSTRESNESGFRFAYIELEDEGCLQLHAVQGVRIERDLARLGSFECDDALVNRIFETAARTTHLCMQNYLWDGIKRDRLVWMGDMHTEVLTILNLFGGQDVVTKSLDFLKSHTPVTGWMNNMPSYSLWWVIVNHDWYLYTGDETYLKKQREYLTALAQKLVNLVDQTGCEQMPGKFLDWPTSEDKAASHEGMQGLLKLALDDAARMLAVLGEKDLSATCAETAQRMQKHGAEPSGSKAAAAILSIAGAADAHAINSERLAKDGARGYSCFMGGYIMEARALDGDVQGALDDMRAFWGGMLQMGATTFWEDFSVDWMENAAPIDEIVPEGKKDIHGDFGAYCYRGFRHSLCHGWSSGPATFLLRYVLGVKPLEPGFERVRVRPQLGDLRYAKGTVPTPKGLLRVEAERQPDGSVRVKIDAPEGITVEQ